MARLRLRVVEFARLERPGARQVVALIDREGPLKHLFEHHDQREQRHFFPELERLVAPAERDALLARIGREWEALGVLDDSA